MLVGALMRYTVDGVLHAVVSGVVKWTGLSATFRVTCMGRTRAREQNLFLHSV